MGDQFSHEDDRLHRQQGKTQGPAEEEDLDSREESMAHHAQGQYLGGLGGKGNGQDGDLMARGPDGRPAGLDQGKMINAAIGGKQAEGGEKKGGEKKGGEKKDGEKKDGEPEKGEKDKAEPGEPGAEGEDAEAKDGEGDGEEGESETPEEGAGKGKGGGGEDAPGGGEANVGGGGPGGAGGAALAGGGPEGQKGPVVQKGAGKAGPEANAEVKAEAPAANAPTNAPTSKAPISGDEASRAIWQGSELAPPEQDGAVLQKKLGELMAGTTGDQAAFAAHAQAKTAQVSAHVTGVEGQIDAAEAQALQQVQQAFAAAGQKLQGVEQSAGKEIDAAANKALADIDKAEGAQVTSLQGKIQAERAAIPQREQGYIKRLEGVLDTGAKNLRAKGEAKAKKSLAFAQKKATGWRSSAASKDGDDAKRDQARAKAAISVGDQFAQTLREKADDAAAALLEKKGSIQGLVAGIMKPVAGGLDKHEQDGVKAVREQAKGQRELVEDQRKRGKADAKNMASQARTNLQAQEEGAVEQTKSSAKALKAKVREAAAQGNQQLTELAQKISDGYALRNTGLHGIVDGKEAPSADETTEATAEISADASVQHAANMAEFEGAAGKVIELLDKAGADAARSLQEGGQKAAKVADEAATKIEQKLADFVKSLSSELNELGAGADGSLGKFVGEAMKPVAEMYKGLDAEVDKKEAEFKKDEADLSTNLDKQLEEAYQKLPEAVDKKAEEEAGKIQPFWKKALKFVAKALVFIAAIVVAVAIFVVAGPAILAALAAVGITGLLGSILAFGIAGALAAVVATLMKDVLFALIDGAKWAAYIVKRGWRGYAATALAGFIGGALGGALGYLKDVGALTISLFSESVIRGVGDGIASVFGDLISGVPVDWVAAGLTFIISAATFGTTKKFVEPRTAKPFQKMVTGTKEGGNAWNRFQSFVKSSGLGKLFGRGSAGTRAASGKGSGVNPKLETATGFTRELYKKMGEVPRRIVQKLAKGGARILYGDSKTAEKVVEEDPDAKPHDRRIGRGTDVE